MLLCVLSLILFVKRLPLFFMILLLSVLKTSRIKFHAQVILFVGFFVILICNWRYIASYEILREDVRTFYVRFLILKYYYFIERGTPFLYRTVNFINGSVTHYLKHYDILIELLSLFVHIVISLKGSIHVCKMDLYGFIFDLWFIWQGVFVYVGIKIRFLLIANLKRRFLSRM